MVTRFPEYFESTFNTSICGYWAWRDQNDHEMNKDIRAILLSANHALTPFVTLAQTKYVSNTRARLLRTKQYPITYIH